MTLLEAGLMSALLNGIRLAQPVLPASPATVPDKQQEGTITVTGQRQAIQTDVDRVSYSIAKDLQAVTGSLADALRNVPSVEVDPLGNVSLRGDPNVMILIDGQPVGSLRGPNRGAAMQQMPADRYERVEVMTNPSAAYGPEGSGGIINLIPKRGRASGLSGSAKAFAGGRGRVNSGLSVSHGTASTTLSGDIGGRRDELVGFVERTRSRLDPLSGIALDTTKLDGRSVTKTQSGTWRMGVEHTIGKSLRLTAEATGSAIRTKSRSHESYSTFNRKEFLPTLSVRDAKVTDDLDNFELRGRASRSFGNSEHRATVDLSYQKSASDRELRAITNGDASDTQGFEQFAYEIDQSLLSFKSEYHRPLKRDGKLQAGYELDLQSSVFDTTGAIGPDIHNPTPLPEFSNRFSHGQSVYGLFATFEQRLGRFTVLPGLRLEHVNVRLHQVTDGARYRDRYTRLYPTLHVTREIGQKSQLKASFSRRVQRPTGRDLNPFLEYRDPLNVRAGNPRLKPQVTDSFEFGWQRRDGSDFYQATAFHRNARDGFTDVVEVLDGGVLLSTRENLNSSHTTGIELIANRKFGDLTVNASVTLARIGINTGLLGFDESRSSWQMGGRANASWQISGRDFLQIGGFLSGKSLRPQGYRAPSGMMNVGYRRKISESLSALVTVRDVLGRFGEMIVYDEPILRDRAKRRFGGRVIMVGLTQSFGATSPSRRDQSFDYEAGRSE